MFGTTAESLELEFDRNRRFRRIVWISAFAHAVGLVAMNFAPRPQIGPMLPPVVQVDLLAALPEPAAAPKAAAVPPPPEAAPAPKPKPKPPVPKKVVLPSKPKPPPKPKAKPAPKPKPAVVPPKPVEKTLDFEELMANMRAEEAATAPKPAGPSAARAPVARGPGTPMSPEMVAWVRQAKIHVTRAWVLDPGFRSLALETEIRVRLGASGDVLGTRVTRRSGNPWYDESVERAIRKASPLPPAPSGDEWVFVFRPEDVF